MANVDPLVREELREFKGLHVTQRINALATPLRCRSAATATWQM